MARLESWPSTNRAFRVVSAPALFRKEREIRMGHLTLVVNARSLDFARDDRNWEMIDKAAERLEKEK